MRTESFKYTKIIRNMNNAQHRKHRKPDEHQRTKKSTDGRSAKLLKEEEQS